MRNVTRIAAVVMLTLGAPTVGTGERPSTAAAPTPAPFDVGSTHGGAADRTATDRLSDDTSGGTSDVAPASEDDQSRPPSRDVDLVPTVRPHDPIPTDASTTTISDAHEVRPEDAEPAGEELEVPRPPESTFVESPAGAPLADLLDPVCVDGTGPDDLTGVFGRDGAVIGADYQRAFPLPSGRVLWLFQDAFVATSHGPELVHNLGLLQSGRCFQVLRNGSSSSPAPYLFPERTDRFDRWFWPLGGDIGDDGNVHVFVAEMREHGSGYLRHTEPVATWLVTIDPVDLAVLDERLAPNSSHELYGWSVVSHADHSYLYAHCYRQFGWDLFPFADPPFRAHDWSCGPNVTVARVPRGQFAATPEYWDGSGWTDDPSTAAPVFPRDDRPVNPAQVAVLDGRFVAVTKVGDWWGRTIQLDTAAAPQGPWRSYETIDVTSQCDVCNTYFASIVPFGADGTSFVIGLSNNTWGGHDLEHYAPTFHRVAAPGPNQDLERCVLIPPGAPSSDGCSPAPIDAQPHETSQPTPQEART